jgi:hypothetical protein
MRNIRILGAGLTGLIAARSLAAHQPIVYERVHTIPHNHASVLRFRTPAVMEATGIPMREVTAIKTWDQRGAGNPLVDALAYGRKVTGVSCVRSFPKEYYERVIRYVAPDSFVTRLCDGLNIAYGVDVTLEDITKWRESGDLIISTLPMSAMEKLLGIMFPVSFPYRSGMVATCRTDAKDVFASVYIPGPHDPVSKVSISDDRAILEYPMNAFDDDMSHVTDEHIRKHILRYTNCYPLVTIDRRILKVMKILPMDEAMRRDCMVRLTKDFGIWSLGRYATWRPGYMLDEVPGDCRNILAYVGDEMRLIKARGV